MGFYSIKVSLLDYFCLILPERTPPENRRVGLFGEAENGMSYFHSLRARVGRAGVHRPVGWLRNFGLDSNDVLLASYGRSGNTLLRFILAEILSGIPATFENIQRLVPEVGLQYHTYPILPGGGRLIKTHEPYCRQYKRAIYIIRDPRDVVLSGLVRETALGCIHPKYTQLDDYIRPFLEGKLSFWGPWASHVEGWTNSPLGKGGDLLVLRFEDMRRDIEGSIARSLQFLGAEADGNAIQAAIRNNSVESMRAKEERSRLAKIAGDGRQVNRGDVLGWRGKMTAHQILLVDACAGHILDRFGYPRGSDFLAGRCTTESTWDASQSGIAPPRHHTLSKARVSRVDLGSGPHPAANRSLRTRVGGQIANAFCWYPY